MNLYRSTGNVWTGTQADAKAAQGGKDFESHEVPTDKAGLLAFINGFIERFGGGAHAPSSLPPETLEEVAAAMPGMMLTMPNTTTFAVAPRSSAGNPSPVNPSDCPACNRSQRTAKMTANAGASVSILADLEDVIDAASLDRIIAAAQARKALV